MSMQKIVVDFRHWYKQHRKLTFGDVGGEEMWRVVEEMKQLPGVHIKYHRDEDKFAIAITTDFMIRIHRY